MASAETILPGEQTQAQATDLSVGTVADAEQMWTCSFQPLLCMIPEAQPLERVPEAVREHYWPSRKTRGNEMISALRAALTDVRSSKSAILVAAGKYDIDTLFAVIVKDCLCRRCGQGGKEPIRLWSAISMLLVAGLHPSPLLQHSTQSTSFNRVCSMLQFVFWNILPNIPVEIPSTLSSIQDACVRLNEDTLRRMEPFLDKFCDAANIGITTSGLDNVATDMDWAINGVWVIAAASVPHLRGAIGTTTILAYLRMIVTSPAVSDLACRCFDRLRRASQWQRPLQNVMPENVMQSEVPIFGLKSTHATAPAQQAHMLPARPSRTRILTPDTHTPQNTTAPAAKNVRDLAARTQLHTLPVPQHVTLDAVQYGPAHCTTHYTLLTPSQVATAVYTDTARSVNRGDSDTPTNSEEMSASEVMLYRRLVLPDATTPQTRREKQQKPPRNVKRGHDAVDAQTSHTDKRVQRDSSTTTSTKNAVSTMCVVCLSAPVTHIFVPCGHYCCCLACAQTIWGKGNRACPCCRGKLISSPLRVFEP